MKTDRWPKAFGAAVLLLALATGAVATPLKSPKRVVGEQTVDLSPLFHWWTNHIGARPLTGWARLTGRVVATNSYGWVLQATVEQGKRPREQDGAEKPGARGTRRVLLLHPPVQDQVAFEQLAAHLARLEDQHSQAAKAESEAHRSLHPRSNAVLRVNTKALAWERHGLNIEEKNAATAKKQLEKQIQDTKARLAAWPSTDHYEVDCFALDTGGSFNGVPVYDHGRSWP